MKSIILSFASVVALSSFGFAEGDMAPDTMVVDDLSKQFYIGLGISAISVRGSSADLSFFSAKPGQDRVGNMTLSVGYDFSQYIGVAGRYTASFARKDVVEMSGWSLFVKPQYPVNEELTLYALIGLGGVTIDSVDTIQPFSADGTDFQWGLGVNYSLRTLLDVDVSLYLDYTSLTGGLDKVYRNGDVQTNIDALTMGVTYRF